MPAYCFSVSWLSIPREEARQYIWCLPIVFQSRDSQYQEKKLERKALQNQDQEMKNFISQQKKEYKTRKEEMKKVRVHFSLLYLRSVSSIRPPAMVSCHLKATVLMKLLSYLLISLWGYIDLPYHTRMAIGSKSHFNTQNLENSTSDTQEFFNMSLSSKWYNIFTSI